jgi:hypothetical protein
MLLVALVLGLGGSLLGAAQARAAMHVQAADTQSVTIRAEATPSTAGTEEVITYSIRVEGATLSDIETPEPPPTTGVVLQRSTPSTRQSVSFSDASLKRTIIFEWRYRPMREGTARFRPTAVRVDGTAYRTAEVTVTVVPQSQRPTRATGPHGGGGARSSTSPRPESSIGAEDLFIRAEMGSPQVYQNEQTTVTYRLYFRPGVQLRHSRLAEAWDATGFWREDLDVAARPVPRTTDVDGTTYRTIVLKRVAVFPTRPGTLRIDPLRIETEAYRARSGTRSGAGYSARGRYQPVTLASDSLTLAARSLPAGAPPAFRGAVGQFDLEVQVDSTAARVGEAVRLEAKVSGTGNIATLQPPSFEGPRQAEVYDPEVRTSIDRSGAAIRGTKTFSYVIVPRTRGTLALPPMRFAFFDPMQGAYRTLEARPPSVDVRGGDAAPAQSTTGEGLPVSDIAGPIASAARWVPAASTPLYRQAWVYAAFALPVLVAGGLLAYRRMAGAASSEADTDDHYAHLDAARAAIADEAPDRCFDEIEAAVLHVVGTRTGRRPRGLTHGTVDAVLREHGVQPDLREAVHALLERCDEVRYTPVQASTEDMAATHDRAQAIVAALDDALPRPDEQVDTAS